MRSGYGTRPTIKRISSQAVGFRNEAAWHPLVPMRFAVTRAQLPHRPIEVSAATFFVVICAALIILCATSRSAAED